MDESVPEHRDAPSSPHELPSEPRAKVVSGKHSIFTHFPKDRNCDVCLRTKITRASCRRRTGTVVPRAEIFGYSITADHKVFSDGCTLQWYKTWQHSGYNHAHVNKHFTGNAKELTKVLGADNETKSHLHRQFPRIWQSLWRSFLESWYVNTTQIGN